jgi:HEAT repeat protein
MGLFGPTEIAKLKANGDVAGLIKVLGDDRDFQRRRDAAAALGELADKRALDALTAALKDADEFVRQHSARALGRLGDAAAVEAVGEALKDGSAGVREAAAKALGEIGELGASESLEAALKDSAVGVREAAAKALAKIGWTPESGQTGEGFLLVQKRDWAGCVRLGSAAVPPLIDALRRRDRHVRQAAAESLGKIADARAAKPLVALLGDTDEHVRDAAVAALVRMIVPAEKPLAAALLDVNPVRRRLASVVLDRTGWSPDKSSAGAGYWIAKGYISRCVEIGTAAVTPLIWALQHDEDLARAEAARALGRICHPRAALPLCAALDDADEPVRAAAAGALVALFESGKLDDVQRAAIVARRGVIVELGGRALPEPAAAGAA